jgi:hypothetical protein
MKAARPGSCMPLAVPSLNLVEKVAPVLVTYVAWHPHCQQAVRFARAIFTTLCSDPEVPASRGPGVPVRFRTSAPDGEPPPGVPFGQAQHTAVFVLADDNLVADPVWRSYSSGLAASAGPTDLMVPVTMTVPANLPPALAARQAIRLNGLPEAQQATYLLNNVMHDICRLLDPDAAQVRVFLSHAKKDGLEITTTIRRYLHEVARLDDFFDTTDVPDGARFAELLREQAGCLPALLAIQTDTYASREWCRLEVLEAKRRHVPIVVLSAVQDREARSFPYMGNVPVVRWRGPESLPFVVSALLSEVLRDRYFPRRVLEICSRHGLSPDRHVFAYPPELVTLLANRQVIRTPDGSRATYLYPDPPLGTEELQLLHQLDPGIDPVTPTILQAL